MKTHKYILLFAVLLFAVGSVQAQQKVVLNLEQTVRLAVDSSMVAQQYRSAYNSSRHQYLAWEASRKPQLQFESTPLMYERYMTRRYLSAEDIDVYRQQRYFYTQAGITATQIMEPWGGVFYGSTQLGYLRAYGDNSLSQFMTVPVMAGYKQDLLFFNPLKWARQLEPLKLSLAEKQLAYGIETVSLQAVERFFALAVAQDQYCMAEEYLASCDTLYAIAERRFNIASISKAELSILELEKTNARTTLANARMTKLKAASALATYLGMDRATNIDLVIPSEIRDLNVNADQAIQYARENNPQYLERRQTVIEARRDAEKARIEKNLSVSLDVSFGLNQVANQFVDAYSHLLPQDMASVTLSVPLVDWGQREHTYLSAKSKVETAEYAERETSRDTELDVILTVAELNERKAIVENARQAQSLAEEAYSQTLQRFTRGQADVYELSLVQSRWQSARQSLITSLQDYWLSYYRLRQLTLHDY